jgi:membrane-associated phospholipid phosphatase
VPWSIIPYWSIDVFYGLSVFVCRTKDELDIVVRRLLTAQIVAVTCFLLFPLQYAFARPATHGLPHLLFVALTRVDRPFNQAPSLHIALLVILWCLYRKHVPRFARWPLHAWSALIGVSVLTTYQHHFFDVPTGALLGLFCVRLWPEGRQAVLKDSQLLGTVTIRLDPRRVFQTPDASRHRHEAGAAEIRSDRADCNHVTRGVVVAPPPSSL